MTKKITATPLGLRYVGQGAALDNIPARDLEAGDLNTIADLWEKDPGVVAAELVATGLYTDAPPAAAESEA